MFPAPSSLLTGSWYIVLFVISHNNYFLEKSSDYRPCLWWLAKSQQQNLNKCKAKCSHVSWMQSMFWKFCTSVMTIHNICSPIKVFTTKIPSVFMIGNLCCPNIPLSKRVIKYIIFAWAGIVLPLISLQIPENGHQSKIFSVWDGFLLLLTPSLKVLFLLHISLHLHNAFWNVFWMYGFISIIEFQGKYKRNVLTLPQQRTRGNEHQHSLTGGILMRS